MRDDQREGYPLPCDPVSGMAWWRFHIALCLALKGYRAWQKDRRMAELVPAIRWLVYGSVTNG